MTIRAFLPVGPIAQVEHADTLLELAFLVTAADGRSRRRKLWRFRDLMGRVRGHVATDDDIGVLYRVSRASSKARTCVDRVKVVAPKLPSDLREAPSGSRWRLR